MKIVISKHCLVLAERIGYNMAVTKDYLRKLIAKAPLEPGLYFFTGPRGRYLYIGKASRIRQRLKSYLRTEDGRISRMVEMASNLTFLVCDSEIEALIMESQHIKRYRPEFNIVMRDDKGYLSVGFTKEAFPKIFLTHQPTALATLHANSFTLTANTIGPFTDGTALKTTLAHLRRLFPYCTCKQTHHNFCLNYHIGKCLGFCCLKPRSPQVIGHESKLAETKKQYRRNIIAIRAILEGRRGRLVKNLEKEMEQRAKSYDFEEAQNLQQKIERIRRVFENARVIQKSSSPELLKTAENIGALARDLNLSRPPVRIEGYDVSNMSGDFGVGAMVVFENGLANPSSYRKFRIRKKADSGQRTVVSKYDQNLKRSLGDTGMLKEVLERRFNHPEWPFPDLIIIDGGKGQLSTALDVIKKITTQKSIQIIALTKDDRHRGVKIFREGFTSQKLTDLTTPSRNLILAVDAEAHRFAISYYRRLHRRKIKNPDFIA